MLYLETERIDPKDIVAVLPIRDADGAKATVLLADGRLIYTNTAAATLKKRLEGMWAARVDR